jgi:hypothetical protein
MKALKNGSNQKGVAAGVRHLEAEKAFEKGIVAEGANKGKKE